MALARTQREWAILVGEYNICKKKLESKREALKIITKEWQSAKKESEMYKNKVNQLQHDLDRCTKNEKKPGKPEQEKPPAPVKSPDLVTSHTSKDTLAQLVYEYKQANKALRHDFQELKKLYIESQEDVQLMRERMRRQSNSSSIHSDEASETMTEDKEDYILQLEQYKEQLANLEQEVKSAKDESSDIVSERDYYKEKCERLNVQLNYILGADDRRLVDIDALVLDNKYLKEKLILLEEERNLEKESIKKYEAVFEKKKNKILHQGNEGRIASYYSKHNNEHSLKTVGDLRNVANILSETITEKNLALSHQRNANRILGKRVSELENKLKTLEVAGLWSLPGHRGYGSANLASNGFDMNKSPDRVPGSVGPLPDRVAHPNESAVTTNTPNEEVESSDNSMLVRLSDDDGIGNPSEINGNILESSCCHNHGEKTPEKHLDNLGQICPGSFGDGRCSSPDPTSSFLHNSPVLIANCSKRKLSRVCSAPCLTRSWSADENGEISS